MESLLQLIVSDHDPAATPSPPKQTKAELDTEDDGCDAFGAFLDKIQVLHLHDAPSSSADASTAPCLSPSFPHPKRKVAAAPSLLASWKSSSATAADVAAFAPPESRNDASAETLPEYPRHLHNDRGQRDRRQRRRRVLLWRENFREADQAVAGAAHVGRDEVLEVAE